MGETSENKPSARNTRMVSPVLWAVLLGTVLLSVYVVLTPPQYPPHSGHVRCLTALKGLSLCLAMYQEDHNRKYPSPERWCDALVNENESVVGPEDTKRVFRCPRAKEGPCNYAMNPYADPCSPADTVLLFKSKPGWNQNGGPELLTTENHGGEGCSVLFVNYSIRFIKAKEVPTLRWDSRGNRTDKEK